MNSVVTPAFLVRAVDYGESDRVVTLLTRDLGVVGAMARGARRSRKRFGAALAPYVRVEATVRERSGELVSLDRLDVVRDFPAIAGDVARSAHAAYLTELSRELLPARSPDADAFDLYAEGLAELDALGARVELLRAFELLLLRIVGLLPRLDACARCGAAGPIAGFDPGRGAVCAACRGRDPLSPISDATRAALGAMLRSPSLQEAASAPLPRAANAEARDALVAFIERYLGKPLRSPRVIAQIRADAKAVLPDRETE